MEDKLTELVGRLRSAFGDRLVSAILYGSAAVGDWHQHSSDLNVLCVLTQVTTRELADAESVLRWWREAGNPPPLVMSRAEVQTSTDCFPMEFHDMQAHRRVLYGEDVVRSLTVDRTFYRAQVEHELRAKQLRLRQQGAQLMSRPDALLALLADSVSTFCVLGRHGLILQGHEPRWKRTEIVADLEQVLGVPLGGFAAVLELRANRQTRSASNAVLLFEKYLAEIDMLVRFVDALDR